MGRPETNKTASMGVVAKQSVEWIGIAEFVLRVGAIQPLTGNPAADEDFARCVLFVLEFANAC